MPDLPSHKLGTTSGIFDKFFSEMHGIFEKNEHILGGVEVKTVRKGKEGKVGTKIVGKFNKMILTDKLLRASDRLLVPAVGSTSR